MDISETYFYRNVWLSIKPTSRRYAQRTRRVTQLGKRQCRWKSCSVGNVGPDPLTFHYQSSFCRCFNKTIARSRLRPGSCHKNRKIGSELCFLEASISTVNNKSAVADSPSEEGGAWSCIALLSRVPYAVGRYEVRKQDQASVLVRLTLASKRRRIWRWRFEAKLFAEVPLWLIKWVAFCLAVTIYRCSVVFVLF